MKQLLILVLWLISLCATAQTVDLSRVPDYPRLKIAGYSLEEVLRKIYITRSTLPQFNEADRMTMTPALDQLQLKAATKPVLAAKSSGFLTGNIRLANLSLQKPLSSTLGDTPVEKQVARIGEMRKDSLLIAAYLENVKDIELAMQNLKAKSELALKHVNTNAPWPSIAQNPGKAITDIMPECCSYLYWYNDYLFLQAQVTEVSDPGQSGFNIKVDPSDREVYQKTFSWNRPRVTWRQQLMTKLLDHRDLVRRDIQELLSVLDYYGPKLSDLKHSIGELLQKNTGIYRAAVQNLRTHLKVNVDSNKKFIDVNIARQRLERDSVISLDSMISRLSALYHVDRRRIETNQDLIAMLRGKNDAINVSLPDLFGKADSIRTMIRGLLKDCGTNDADDGCVKYPDSLKKLNTQLDGLSRRLDSLNGQKVDHLDKMLVKERDILQLAENAERAYIEMEELKDAFQEKNRLYHHQWQDVEDRLYEYRKRYELYARTDSIFKIFIGEAKDPFYQRLEKEILKKEIQLPVPISAPKDISPLKGSLGTGGKQF